LPAERGEEVLRMGIGVSLFLIAVGAVLAFAVNVPASGIDIDTVGVILMAIGFGVLLYSLIWWSDYMPWRRDHTVIREHYVEPPARPEITERAVTREREVIEYDRRAS
jgi:hypothetical protein